jgi:hypothetical protein
MTVLICQRGLPLQVGAYKEEANALSLKKSFYLLGGEHFTGMKKQRAWENYNRIYITGYNPLGRR